MSKQHTKLHADIQEALYKELIHFMWTEEAEKESRRIANTIINLIDEDEKSISKPGNA